MFANVLKPKGRWLFKHYRKFALIDEWAFNNGIVDVGMNKLLDVFFRNQTQIAAFYVGLIDNASYSALAAGDTMGSHGGWIENNDYDEAARVTWSPGAAASRLIVNSSAMEFTMNATKTIKGAFVTSVSTKTGNTGTLWATGLFGTAKSVVATDVLRATYQLSG